VEKWQSFGWSVKEVPGHDVDALAAELRRLPFEKGKPNCLVCHTTKGKGVSFMEADPVKWHYRAPDERELARALQELDGAAKADDRKTPDQ
jgi:transketolase